jgi:hypothetical protein
MSRLKPRPTRRIYDLASIYSQPLRWVRRVVFDIAASAIAKVSAVNSAQRGLTRALATLCPGYPSSDCREPRKANSLPSLAG